MKTNNQIKEIEKEIEEERKRNLPYNDYLGYLELELKLLKQFQKEIKEVQGELIKELGEFKEVEDCIKEIFKNKFGEMK